MGHPQLPAVERHPMRQRIIDALLSGEGPKTIAKWVKPPISHVSLWRYRETQLKPALERAANARKLLSASELVERPLEKSADLQQDRDLASGMILGDPLLNRVTAKFARYDRWFEKAEQVQDFQALSGIDRAETQALRFNAELTGRLTTGSQTLVQIVVNGNTSEPVKNDDKLLTDNVIDIDVAGSDRR